MQYMCPNKGCCGGGEDLQVVCLRSGDGQGKEEAEAERLLSGGGLVKWGRWLRLTMVVMGDGETQRYQEVVQQKGKREGKYEGNGEEDGGGGV